MYYHYIIIMLLLYYHYIINIISNIRSIIYLEPSTDLVGHGCGPVHIGIHPPLVISFEELGERFPISIVSCLPVDGAVL